MISLNSDKFNTFVKENEHSKFTALINAYYNYTDCNSFGDLKCPCCKKKGILHFHKTYDRNITYIENDCKIDSIIDITVLECSNCRKLNNKQKYHALLPDFILPYHIYEASLIINALYSRIVKNNKLTAILERIKISHKIFYDWLKKIITYSFSASIILSLNNDLISVIDGIYNLNGQFLNNFYDYYLHPFFLFKQTCVPLSITP